MEPTNLFFITILIIICITVGMLNILFILAYKKKSIELNQLVIYCVGTILVGFSVVYLILYLAFF